MMILRSSLPSPYGRKVKLAAAILGLADDITMETADTNNPADSLRVQNPLGKIPILILEDGTTLFDSRVILEYLDHLRRRRPDHSARGQGALRGLAPAGLVRRHSRCLAAARL